MPYLRKLKALIENPRHSFLLEGFSAVLMLSILKDQKLEPTHVFSKALFSKKGLNKKFYRLSGKKVGHLPNFKRANALSKKSDDLFD